jgi:CHAT domain-containing protein/tetratricopeptide (TPR) repeat protein
MHTYIVELQAGQALRALLQQEGADLVAEVGEVSGKRLADFDSNANWFGVEPITIVAATPGFHRIQITCRERGTPSGRYRLMVLEIGAPTPRDRERIRAVELSTEAKRLAAREDSFSRRQAIERFREAARLWRALEESSTEAQLHCAIGTILTSQNYIAALESFWEAERLWQAAGDLRGQALALNGIACIADRQGDKRKALELYDQALGFWRASSDRRGEGQSLSGIGATQQSLGDWRKALESYDQALTLLQEAGSAEEQTRVLMNTGEVHAVLGEKQKAFEYFQKSLRLARIVRNRGAEAFLLYNLGRIFHECGEEQRALDQLERARQIREDLGDRIGEAETLSLLGTVLEELGELDRAFANQERMRLVARSAHDQRGEAVALNNLGRVYERLGDTQKALEAFSEANRMSEKVSDVLLQAYSLDGLGRVRHSIGDRQAALDLYSRALEISRSFNHRRLEATSNGNLGVVHFDLGNHAQAHQCFEHAAQLGRAIREPSIEAAAELGTARVFVAEGDLESARRHAEAALAIQESRRSTVEDTGLRASFSAWVRDYYETYIDVLMRLDAARPEGGFAAAALEASEKSRARSLLESQAEMAAQIRRAVPQELLDQERELQRQINAAAGNGLTDGAPEMEALLTGLQHVRTRIRRASPRYAQLTQPRIVTASVVQTELLDEQSLLLEYFLGRTRSYLWAVTPKSLKGFALPPRDEIESKVQLVRQGLSRRNTAATGPERDVLGQAVTILGRILLGPVARDLAGKRLIIVGDEALHYLPFSILPEPGPVSQVEGATTPLVVGHEIVTLPSISFLRALREELAGRRPAPAQLAVIADPVFSPDDPRVSAGGAWNSPSPSGRANLKRAPFFSDLVRSAQESGVDCRGGAFDRLPFTRREGQMILASSRSARDKAAFDFAASRDTLVSADIGRYRFVHIASHALVNNRRPDLSGIVLSLVDERGQPRDGFLRLHEIYNLNLPAELVTLSACRTGFGKQMRGEGLAGLARGFLNAGAARVVASLWDVNDVATSELMTRFYQGVFGPQKLSAAAALRAAQTDMWKSERWRPPYYWAGFLLYGEWR